MTNRGGRTCHAAIVARELGAPAVVGTGEATSRITSGATLTVSCAEGDLGKVYQGAAPLEARTVELADLPNARTEIMLNLGDPDLAFHAALLPSADVGLARMAFIIQRHIGIHPMALADPAKVTADRAAIARAKRLYANPT